MSLRGRSFLSIRSLSQKDIQFFFAKVSEIKKTFCSHKTYSKNLLLVQKVAALLFFEPSTRTRFSFEIAARRLGISSITLDSAASTSLVKGEGLVETIQNISSMHPDLLIVRHSGQKDVREALVRSQIPVINAGDGTDEHPTQALLDAFTILTHRPLQGTKVLFVGDLKHSRVAHSDRLLFQNLGCQIGFCSPDVFLPVSPDWKSSQRFEKLSDGLAWCDVVIGLRLQQERHDESHYMDLNQYIENYRLDHNSLRYLKSEGIIMHPGPFVPEVDLSSEITNDPRCRILQQVENGVFVRMALMDEILGLTSAKGEKL